MNPGIEPKWVMAAYEVLMLAFWLTGLTSGWVLGVVMGDFWGEWLRKWIRAKLGRAAACGVGREEGIGLNGPVPRAPAPPPKTHSPHSPGHPNPGAKTFFTPKILGELEEREKEMESAVPSRWQSVDKVLDLSDAMDAHFHNALVELGTAESRVCQLVGALQALIGSETCSDIKTHAAARDHAFGLLEGLREPE